MRVLKVVAEGVTTSFRYPYFMQKIHPSYPMPPPATIYGHICSALGEWFEADGVQFAYHFTHEGQVKDLEHIIVLSPSSGVLKGGNAPKVMEGNVNPFERDLLFRPRLTLYLNQPEWIAAFRSPKYAVVLGRSQDLFTYTSVGVVELERATRAYFEHTLLPHNMALQIAAGITVLMPRYLDLAQGRTPVFDRYLVIEKRVHLPKIDSFEFAGVAADEFWVDPTSEQLEGAFRGVQFLSFL